MPCCLVRWVISCFSGANVTLLASPHRKRRWGQRTGFRGASSLRLECFEYIWTRLPVCIRAFTYKRLALLGQSIYGSSRSDRSYRLLFNLYLLMAPRQWALKHEAELQSLKLVGEYTQIPAPRGIDVVQCSDFSYLLMTSVPGQRIGQILSIMTDEQFAGRRHFRLADWRNATQRANISERDRLQTIPNVRSSPGRRCVDTDLKVAQRETRDRIHARRLHPQKHSRQ